MATTDALPVPQKNVAYRVYFDIRKNDGTLITSWAGADSNISKDGGNFAACDNEATEIQTSGTGYLELTATEMNADSVVLKTTVTNTGALPVVITFYPEEAGNIRTNAAQIGGTTQTGRDLGTSVLLSSGTGTGQLDITSGVVKANLAQILGTALTETAGQIAAAFKKFFDKATPTGTVNSLPDATAGGTGGVAIVGSSMAVGAGGISNTSFATDTVLRNIRSGQVNSATASTIVLDGAASSVNNFYDGQIVMITAGTGINQARVIKTYTGSTKSCTITENWATTPAGGDTYVIIPLGDVEVGSLMPGIITATEAPALANLDAAITTRTKPADTQAAVTTVTNLTNAPTNGDFTSTMKTSLNAATPASVVGAVGSVTGNVGGSVASVTGAVGSVTGAVGSVTGNVGGNVAGSVGSIATGGISAASIADDAIDAGSIKADAVTKIQSGLSTLTAAQVNAEVVDALTIDVIADSVAADGSRPTIAQALLMIARFLMEKSVSGTTVTVKKEDGSTASMTFTLNDGTSPSSITRTT